MQFENERERGLVASLLSYMNDVPINGPISQVRGFINDLTEVQELVANAPIVTRDTSGEDEMLASR